MIPRFYRFTKFSGRPDLAKVSEINAVAFPRSPAEFDQEGQKVIPLREGKQALSKKENPLAQPAPAEFERKRNPLSDFQAHFQSLRSLWDPYAPVGLIQHPTKIVAGVDNSPFNESLLKFALRWAEKYRASLIAVHVLEGLIGKEEKDAIRNTLREWMRGFSDSAQFKDHAPREEILDPAEPAISLIRFAHQENASLLIVGTHQREGKEKFLLGSVAERVLKEALSPVLVIPPFYHKIALRRILVPHEGSHFSDLALAQALILCHDFEADLWVIHGEGESKGMNPDHAQFLQKMSGLNWKEIHHESVSRPGEGPETVLDFAQTHDVDLIVMATHRREESSQSFEQSFTAAVVRKTPCPVLVVHP